jgi:hypothetical protein
MKCPLTILLLIASMPWLQAERDIVPIFQPLSLLGTELEAYPLGQEEGICADVMATPAIVSSAYPEAIVQAIGLPHRFYQAPEGFPAESNLLVLTGARLDAAWGEERHAVTIDFSQVSLGGNLGVTLDQLCRLTVLCLSKSLRQGYSDSKPIDLHWKLPQNGQELLAGLPSVLAAEPVQAAPAADP